MAASLRSKATLHETHAHTGARCQVFVKRWKTLKESAIRPLLKRRLRMQKPRVTHRLRRRRLSERACSKHRGKTDGVIAQSSAADGRELLPKVVDLMRA